MKKVILFNVIFVCTLGFCVGQNIILNGGFEEFSECPTSPGDIDLAIPWYPGGTDASDLFNTCGQGEWCTSPYNIYGVQNPHSGNGYSIIGCTSILFPDANEILMQPMRYVLTGGEEYYFEVYVSLADSVNYAVHNIAVVFEDTILNPWLVLDCLLDSSFDCNPLIENTSANPLMSKTEWMKISGTFIAQGWEKYIFIGNVRPGVLTEFEYVGGGAPNGEFNWDFAAYYIDDVWLSHIDSMHYVGVGEQLAIGNDQFTIWPNPSGGEFSVAMQLPDERAVAELEIWDITGRKVHSNKLSTGLNNIDARSLNSGLYILIVRVNGSVVHTGREVITR